MSRTWHVGEIGVSLIKRSCACQSSDNTTQPDCLTTGNLNLSFNNTESCERCLLNRWMSCYGQIVQRLLSVIRRDYTARSWDQSLLLTLQGTTRNLSWLNILNELMQMGGLETITGQIYESSTCTYYGRVHDLAFKQAVAQPMSQWQFRNRISLLEHLFRQTTQSNHVTKWQFYCSTILSRVTEVNWTDGCRAMRK